MLEDDAEYTTRYGVKSLNGVVREAAYFHLPGLRNEIGAALAVREVKKNKTGDNSTGVESLSNFVDEGGGPWYVAVILGSLVFWIGG